MSKTREKYPLSTKKIIKKTIGAMIVLTFFMLFMYGFFAMTAITLSRSLGGGLLIATVIFILLLAGLFALIYLYEKWYFDVYYYELDPNYIIIKKGPITPREITIPYERIQDVYVDQDLFDRFFGLYDVHLSSATASSGMEAHIDGVEKTAADGLRAELLSTVSERISKNKASKT